MSECTVKTFKFTLAQVLDLARIYRANDRTISRTFAISHSTSFWEEFRDIAGGIFRLELIEDIARIDRGESPVGPLVFDDRQPYVDAILRVLKT